MAKRQKKRPCRLCGEDLNLWGPDRRGDCPNCAKAIRDAKVKCAGRCGESYQLRYMTSVTIMFSPGKKGGKKYRVYYCQSCASGTRSRTEKIAGSQSSQLEVVEARIKRKSSGRKLERGDKNETPSGSYGAVSADGFETY